MTDIIERLRAFDEGDPDTWVEDMNGLMAVAADEITILREQLAKAVEGFNLLSGYTLNTADKIRLAQATLAAIKGETPEAKEILAEAILKISDGFDALLKSGLNRDAVVVLLHYRTKISRRDIIKVSDGLRHLRGWYCKVTP